MASVQKEHASRLSSCYRPLELQILCSNGGCTGQLLCARLLKLVRLLSAFALTTGHGRWADWSGKVDSHQHTLC
jgi:hypothetical protein